MPILIICLNTSIQLALSIPIQLKPCWPADLVEPYVTQKCKESSSITPKVQIIKDYQMIKATRIFEKGMLVNFSNKVDPKY